MSRRKVFCSGIMARHHLIAICVTLLPAIVFGVDISLIMSANEEVRTLLHSPAVANVYQQCIVDQSLLYLPVPKLAHLHTVTDVIGSFISKSGLYPVSETDALLFQTELASSIVDVVVNEPSQQQDYAHTLSTFIGILRDCQARSTGQTTSDLADIIQTFTKLFVDVIVNVEKINAEEQKLLQTFQQVDSYGIGEGSGQESVELPLQPGVDNTASSTFQSNIQQPVVVSPNVVSTNSKVTESKFPSVASSVVHGNTNNENLHSVTLNINSPEVLSSSQTDTSLNIPAKSVAFDNSKSSLSSNFNQGEISTSGNTINGLNVPPGTIVSSNSPTSNNYNIQTQISGENTQAIPSNNFQEQTQTELSHARVRRSVSDSNFDISTNKNKTLIGNNVQIPKNSSKSYATANNSNIKNISSRNDSNGNDTVSTPSLPEIKKSDYNTNHKGNNKSANYSSETKPKEKSDLMKKVISSAVMGLIKSGRDEIVSDFINDAIRKENFFDPAFLSQIKEHTSKIMLNTMESLSRISSAPATIREFLKNMTSRKYIDDFTYDLYTAMGGTPEFDSSDSHLKTLAKTIIGGVVNILARDINRNEYYEENVRNKRDNEELIQQETLTPQATIGLNLQNPVLPGVSSYPQINTSSNLPPLTSPLTLPTFTSVPLSQQSSALSSSTSLPFPEQSFALSGATSEPLTQQSFAQSSTISVPLTQQSILISNATSVPIAEQSFALSDATSVPLSQQSSALGSDIPLVFPKLFAPNFSSFATVPQTIPINNPIPLFSPLQSTIQATSTSSSLSQNNVISSGFSDLALNLLNPSITEIKPSTNLFPSTFPTNSNVSSTINTLPTLPIQLPPTSAFSTTFSDAITSSIASTNIGSNAPPVIQSEMKANESENIPNNVPSPTSITITPPKVVIERKKTPTIVKEFSSAFSIAVASHEIIVDAVELTLHGQTTTNTIYKILFDTLLEEGVTDPTAEGKSHTYYIASNFDGMTPLVFTNALSAAVADALLDEGLITFYSIKDLTDSYINTLEDTLIQLDAQDDTELNSKALVIGTERFLSSHGISLLHGGEELASHFKAELISAREEIIKNRESSSSFTEYNYKEPYEVEYPRTKCASDPTSSTSFSRYFLNVLEASNTLKGIFKLPEMTEETAAIFYKSFTNAALSLGIEITEPEGKVFSNILSTGLSRKSPAFFTTIFGNSLQIFLCERDVLNDSNALALSRIFAQILEKTTSSLITIDGKPEVYFNLLLNATFHFLISLLILKPLNNASWSSNFLSELVSTSPVYLPNLLREVAPEIFSPQGLKSADATERIYTLAVSVAYDALSEGSQGVNIPFFVNRLYVILGQIQKNNPTLEPISLVLETFLEAISALVTVINAAQVESIDFSNSNSDTVTNELVTALKSWQ